MAIPKWMLNETCAIHRPLGDAVATFSQVACRLVPDLIRGGNGKLLKWTDYLDVAVEVDIRDGTVRPVGSNTLTFADGDEVRIRGRSYVVVWVEWHNENLSTAFKRAYLMRNEAGW